MLTTRAAPKFACHHITRLCSDSSTVSGGHRMGNSSGKGEGEAEEEEEEEEEVENDGEEVQIVQRKKIKEEPEEELPLGVDELLESGDPVLDISYRKFKRLPARVCGLTHLEKLYACGNRLRAVPEGLSQLRGLRILALDFNKMEDVPLAICQLANLSRLYLGSNRLMTLPPELKNLRCLRCLWLESNYFQWFPKELYGLPNLKSLQIGDNRLKTLPPDLCCMENLRGLWLYGNRFQSFPKVLLSMDGLEILDLDRNKISEFPNLMRLRSLRLFSYDHNPVQEPPKVGDEVVVVGEGATEFLEEREARKDRQRKEAEEAALVGEEPVIHGILKNSGSRRAANEDDFKEGEGEEAGTPVFEHDGGDLEYDDEAFEYETEGLICEGEALEYEGEELQYDRAYMDYEYEEEMEEKVEA
ncbi:leucine-rich repeat-containing protein 10B [Stigmatopora argus]